jgi:hypothetical protein
MRKVFPAEIDSFGSLACLINALKEKEQCISVAAVFLKMKIPQCYLHSTPQTINASCFYKIIFIPLILTNVDWPLRRFYCIYTES